MQPALSKMLCSYVDGMIGVLIAEANEPHSCPLQYEGSLSCT